VAGQEHELEAVLNLIDAVLDGDASHQAILVREGRIWLLFRRFAETKQGKAQGKRPAAM
jgi:hypothetical protein